MSRRRFRLLTRALPLFLLLLVGCVMLVQWGLRRGEEPVPREAGLREAAPAEREIDPKAVGADESGLIVVLQYHRVGGDMDFAPEWTISARDFRSQLEYLHEHGYHPVNFRDLIENRLDVPAGKTPVVLTFDDSSDSQFTMVKKDGSMVPDPGGAVGVLSDFHEEHPDWPMRATFFVLPAADPPNDLFGQPELAGDKLRYLVDNGMEVGNHTLYHAILSQTTPQQTREQLARAVEEIQKHLGPDYEVTTMSVPFGEYPEDTSLLVSGTWQGLSYAHSGAADVEGGASYPPADRRLDPYKVPRIQAEPYKGGFRWFADYFEKNPKDRYVSDGDPRTVSVPRGHETHLEPDTLTRTGNELRVY
jgi:peptidoglycan/xylan/chitin deacetylase (PgdA/CDA1 family)